MIKSSSISSINIYLRQEAKLLSYKYSPQHRREQTRNFRASLPNTHSHKTISSNKFKPHPYLNNNAPTKTPRLVNPEKSPHTRSNSLKEFQSTLSKKLQNQRKKFEEMQAISRVKQEQARKNRALKNRLQTRQSKRNVQQFQYKYQQTRRQQQLKLRRKTSERSFIFQTRQESIDMMKRSRQISARSEMKLTKDNFFQTEKNHEYLLLKATTSKLQQNYQFKYRKAFVKNQTFKVGKYPNLASTLAISTKMIAQHGKGKLLPTLKDNSKQKVLNNKLVLTNKKPIPKKETQRKTQAQLTKTQKQQPKLDQDSKSSDLKQQNKVTAENQPKLELQTPIQKVDSKPNLEDVPTNPQRKEVIIKNT